MDSLSQDNSLLADTKWHAVVESALTSLKLTDHPAAELIRTRVEERVRRGRDLLAQGGINTEKISVELGPLSVELQPDQVFREGAGQRLRFIRANESSFSSMKQPLAALLDAHHQSGGRRTAIEVATLSDGKTTSVGTIKASTRGKYETVAIRLCAKQFPVAPSDERICHFCAYMFACSKRVTQ
jgi:hypothetical protein